MFRLERIKRTSILITPLMSIHYSHPKGFVGRNLCYAAYCDNICYGAIVAGSAVRHLAMRDAFLGWSTELKEILLNSVVNNLFYSIRPFDIEYPVRNFGAKLLREFRKRVEDSWYAEYGNQVVAFESLVELPRTGMIYKQDNWHEVGITKGYTCKRIADPMGEGTDSWTDKRIWDTTNLRPKRVFVRKVCR